MDEDGFIRESYSYDEFGQVYTDESHQGRKPLQPFGFTGYQMDEAGGLYYAQARRYDAVNGRFVSKDSDRYINKTHPASWNQYIYCDNNPEKYIDPSGNVYIIVWSYGTKDAQAYEDWVEDLSIYDSYYLNPDNFLPSVEIMAEEVGPINAPKTKADGDPAPTADWTLDMWYEFCRRSSFARAAYTRYDELVASGIPEEEIMIVRVDGREDLIEKWNSWTQLESVQGIEFFSHGLSGEPNMYCGSTGLFDYSSDDHVTLPKLNWEPNETCTNPYMIFYGCNTAEGDTPQGIADYHGVYVYGNKLVTAFTEEPDKYNRIVTWETSHDVYLGQVVKSDNEAIQTIENITKHFCIGPIRRNVVPHTVFKPQATKE